MSLREYVHEYECMSVRMYVCMLLLTNLCVYVCACVCVHRYAPVTQILLHDFSLVIGNYKLPNFLMVTVEEAEILHMSGVCVCERERERESVCVCV